MLDKETKKILRTGIINENSILWNEIKDGVLNKDFFERHGISKTRLKKIYAPAFITNIGRDAISNYYNLRIGSFPGVNLVKEYALRYNYSLEDINILDSANIAEDSLCKNKN